MPGSWHPSVAEARRSGRSRSRGRETARTRGGLDGAAGGALEAVRDLGDFDGKVRSTRFATNS